MARLAPVDRYGMPYAIAPTEAPPSATGHNPTEHHAFYRSRAPQLANGLGRALRLSRVHVLPDWLHQSYHKKFMGGLEAFPETEVDTFGLLILSCAGYLSKEAWHRRSNGNFELDRMDEATYQQVRSRRLLHPETELNSRIPADGPDRRRTQDVATKTIGEELTLYARRQNLSHIKDEDYVDEFLNTEDVIRRHEIGRRILREAALVAVDPIRPIYEEALSEGLVRAGEPDPAKIIIKFSFAGDWLEHEEVLAQQLAA